MDDLDLLDVGVVEEVREDLTPSSAKVELSIRKRLIIEERDTPKKAKVR